MNICFNLPLTEIVYFVYTYFATGLGSFVFLMIREYVKADIRRRIINTWRTNRRMFVYAHTLSLLLFLFFWPYVLIPYCYREIKFRLRRG